MTSPFSSIVNISSSIEKALTPSHFANQNPNEMSLGQTFFSFIILGLVVYLTMCLGSFVFNTSVVKIFPSVKKTSILDFFGLYIVLHLLMC
jgi:hypothetical protein